jgi:hypothetical protein
MTGSNNQIKTGSYAVSTVYSMPWSKKPTAVPKAKKKRTEKKVVHEIFEMCSDLTNDPYWISVFKECSRDKFPRGFSYKNGLLIHRRGNKLKRILIPTLPDEAFSIAVNFFKTSAGLMSNGDRKKLQKEEEEKLLEANSSKELLWKDIRTERVKEILISEFVRDLSLKMNYDENKRKELATTIKIGFMLKYFTGKNIVMEDSKVIDIIGLTYDKENNNFFIDPKYSTKKPVRKVKGLGIEPAKKKAKVSFISNWDKYIQSLDKKNEIDSNFNVIGATSSLSRDMDDDDDDEDNNEEDDNDEPKTSSGNRDDVTPTTDSI